MATPKSSPVITVKVAAASLSSLSTADLMAVVEAARAEMAAAKPATIKRVRVNLSAEDAASVAVVSWQAPYADAKTYWQPAEGSSATADRASKLAPFYTVLSDAMAAGPVALPDMARLLHTVLNGETNKRSIASLMQTLANRMQRGIKQEGKIFTLSGVTGA